MFTSGQVSRPAAVSAWVHMNVVLPLLCCTMTGALFCTCTPYASATSCAASQSSKRVQHCTALSGAPACSQASKNFSCSHDTVGLLHQGTVALPKILTNCALCQACSLDVVLNRSASKLSMDCLLDS